MISSSRRTVGECSRASGLSDRGGVRPPPAARTRTAAQQSVMQTSQAPNAKAASAASQVAASVRASGAGVVLPVRVALECLVVLA